MSEVFCSGLHTQICFFSEYLARIVVHNLLNKIVWKYSFLLEVNGLIVIFQAELIGYLFFCFAGQIKFLLLG